MTGSLTIPEPENTYYGNGESVTLTGTGFGSSGSGTINFGGVEINASSVSYSSLTFNTPITLKSGAYTVLVNPNNQGYAGAYEGHIYFNVNSVSPNNISKGGAVITISGNGFDSENAKVFVGSNECRIITIVPNEIKCRV